MCVKEADKDKETSRVNYNKGEENTSSTSEARNGYVCMYEHGKHLLYSLYERAWAAHEKNISNMREMV